MDDKTIPSNEYTAGSAIVWSVIWTFIHMASEELGIPLEPEYFITLFVLFMVAFFAAFKMSAHLFKPGLFRFLSMVITSLMFSATVTTLVL